MLTRRAMQIQEAGCPSPGQRWAAPATPAGQAIVQDPPALAPALGTAGCLLFPLAGKLITSGIHIPFSISATNDGLRSDTDLLVTWGGTDEKHNFILIKVHRRTTTASFLKPPPTAWMRTPKRKVDGRCRDMAQAPGIFPVDPRREQKVRPQAERGTGTRGWREVKVTCQSSPRRAARAGGPLAPCLPQQGGPGGRTEQLRDGWGKQTRQLPSGGTAQGRFQKQAGSLLSPPTAEGTGLYTNTNCSSLSSDWLQGLTYLGLTADATDRPPHCFYVRLCLRHTCAYDTHKQTVKFTVTPSVRLPGLVQIPILSPPKWAWDRLRVTLKAGQARLGAGMLGSSHLCPLGHEHTASLKCIY